LTRTRALPHRSRKKKKKKKTGTLLNSTLYGSLNKRRRGERKDSKKKNLKKRLKPRFEAERFPLHLGGQGAKPDERGSRRVKRGGEGIADRAFLTISEYPKKTIGVELDAGWPSGGGGAVKK